ncbi:hypothetical protein Trydic_g21227 [Trypoxylus dichotomus]
MFITSSKDEIYAVKVVRVALDFTVSRRRTHLEITFAYYRKNFLRVSAFEDAPEAKGVLVFDDVGWNGSFPKTIYITADFAFLKLVSRQLKDGWCDFGAVQYTIGCISSRTPTHYEAYPSINSRRRKRKLLTKTASSPQHQSYRGYLSGQEELNNVGINKIGKLLEREVWRGKDEIITSAKCNVGFGTKDGAIVEVETK